MGKLLTIFVMISMFMKSKYWGYIMDEVIKAIYENGVFKPLKKPNLKEGQRVRIIIEEKLIDIVYKFREKYGLRIPSSDLEKFFEKRR